MAEEIEEKELLGTKYKKGTSPERPEERVLDEKFNKYEEEREKKQIFETSKKESVKKGLATEGTTTGTKIAKETAKGYAPQYYQPAQPRQSFRKQRFKKQKMIRRMPRRRIPDIPPMRRTFIPTIIPRNIVPQQGLRPQVSIIPRNIVPQNKGNPNVKKRRQIDFRNYL